MQRRRSGEALILAVLAGCAGAALVGNGSPVPVAVGVVAFAVALVAAQVDLRFATLGWLIPSLVVLLLSFVLENVQLRSALLRAAGVAGSTVVLAAMFAAVGRRARPLRLPRHSRRARTRRRPRMARTLSILSRFRLRMGGVRLRRAVEARVRRSGFAGADVAALTGTVLLTLAAALAVPAVGARLLGASPVVDEVVSWQLGIAAAGLIASVLGGGGWPASRR